jgi:hypothetical protein
MQLSDGAGVKVPQAAVLALPVAIVVIVSISRQATDRALTGPSRSSRTDPVLLSGTDCALRSMAAEPGRPASHRCVLGESHGRWRCGSRVATPTRPASLDYSVAVKERSP